MYAITKHHAQDQTHICNVKRPALTQGASLFSFEYFTVKPNYALRSHWAITSTGLALGLSITMSNADTMVPANMETMYMGRLVITPGMKNTKTPP